MTHTSTSPSYQILASLDVGRRQAALEGYALVQRQVELAMMLRDAAAQHPAIAPFMRFLSTPDLIPEEYRESGVARPMRSGPEKLADAWRLDEFVLDPTRATLAIAETGVGGDAFRQELMNAYGVQVNKTSHNSVLFMTNIGTRRSTVAYLVSVLARVARELDQRRLDMSPDEQTHLAGELSRLRSSDLPLPDFSEFHPRFRPDSLAMADGDIRAAFYAAQDPGLIEHVSPAVAQERHVAGRPATSAAFVTPYPPGFPVLVPGQQLTENLIEFLSGIGDREIHGYDTAIGYRVFREGVLD